VSFLLDGNSVTGLGSKVKELFNHALVTVRILAQRVDNPKLTQVHSSGDSSRFRVSGNELDVLNTATLVKLEQV
jgi:hypothetical protein